MSCFFSCNLLLFLLVYADAAKSQVHYYITPSLSARVDCPGKPCLTLAQFAANYVGNETNISLFFLPGNHSLNGELSLSHADYFSMTKVVRGNGTVFVKCGNQSGRFNISETIFATIKDLHFVGCGGNSVSQVEQFIVEDTIFEGVEGRGTALVLNEVTDANITRNSFLYNAHNSTFQHDHDVTNFPYLEDVLNYILDYINRNPSLAVGGALYTAFSNVSIVSSNFTDNRAEIGGALIAHNSSLHVVGSTYSYNKANFAGVMVTSESSINIKNSNFCDNTAKVIGGVMIAYRDYFSISGATFTNNNAGLNSGVIATHKSSFSITNSIFSNNSAFEYGGVIVAFNGSFIIKSSTFTNNNAVMGGVVFSTLNSELLFNITSSTFTNNSAISGGVAHAESSSFNIFGSSFYANKANRGIMLTFECSMHIINGTFEYNSGSFHIFNSHLTFSGYTRLENITEQSLISIQSTVIFTGVSSLSNNQASSGAISATESKIVMYGETTIANNTATAMSSGGGISLRQSDLEVRGNCTISGNDAVRGGGIHATSSTITVYDPWTLQFINNRAKNGSGLYLEDNAKLYVIKPTSSHSWPLRPIYTSRRPHSEHLLFRANHANYGGAIYVADNSDACSPDNECFIQTLALHRYYIEERKVNILFSGNTASEQGANIFGGLLDRCIPSQFAEVLQYHVRLGAPPPHYNIHSGVSYLGNITNITVLGTISSLPVRVCFCKSNGEPDCSYQPPTFNIKKGEIFTVPLVAVDQVNHSVDANIISSLSSQDGGFSEGQQTQSVGRNCSNVTFNVFSPHDSETIKLFADGPCGSSKLSIEHLNIQFINCTCLVGFQQTDSNTRCGCECDSKLSPHITNCSSTTGSLVRVDTNSWITHINDTDPPGYIIHLNCPFDYCQPPTESVSVNLNLPNGSDAQCAYNRSGVLCGGCQKHFSLSLGSSRCLSCHSHWPAVLVVILLAAIVVGILLVTALLIFNMTVAVGLINGFIFYANIVAANSAVFFPSSEPSFPTLLVAWLNLDIGIDVCFFNGLDAYTKTWLQLVFPIYIIFLVIIVIIVSEYSPRFARLIGKRDPVATLATLILLSYAKLLSVTITVLSFAVLDYPDGSRETVWLPDGNVPYFQGKHVALVLVALLIILVGTPYTILLFLWQWLVRAPKWKVFKWTRNTKLNAFISVHHVPYNNKYRYWTGLLLLVRVVLYITASVTVSADPQTSQLIAIISIGSLFLVKEITGARVYKESFLNIIETGIYFNLLAFSAFSWYRFKIDAEKQTAIAYTSTIITFVLLVGVIIYHVYLLVRKDHPRRGEDVNEYPLAPVQPGKDEVTFSVIEIPKPRDQSPPPEDNIDQIEVKEIICMATPEYC